MIEGDPGTVLVTGASGRIGSLLLARLPALGWDVRGCDVREGPSVERADITSLSDMERVCAGVDVVMHLAGAPNANGGWAHVSRLNIEGTRTVLEAARRCGARRVVHASSIHTIGALPAGTPFTPDMPSAPSGLYGATKLAAEALLAVYALGGLATTAVRICSFRPAPTDARELTTWLGQDDCVHLFDRCGRDEAPSLRTVWGVSANAAAWVVDPVAEAIGYRPRQSAERASADPASLPDQGWTTLGGPVTDATRDELIVDP